MMMLLLHINYYFISYRWEQESNNNNLNGCASNDVDVAHTINLASASVILFRCLLSFISQENVGVQVDDVAKTEMRNSLVTTANLIPKGYLSMSKSYCFVLLFCFDVSWQIVFYRTLTISLSIC